MLISYNWLKEYVDFSMSVEELSELITNTGLEVEEISHTDDFSQIPESVVVGRVVSVKGHPNADRLTVCLVDDGLHDEIQVVCGAPNVAVGQKVAFAPVGTVLKNAKGEQITLSTAIIRGVESYGMLCAEDELSISSDHSGIMVLPVHAVPGTKLKTFLQEKADPVLEIAITPNRGDAISHLGVARDIAAVLRKKVRWPDVTGLKAVQNPLEFDINISVPELCYRYCGIVMTQVNVKQSPLWMQERLKSVGINPINNIVDITNFVMMECGQPLHAFDLSVVEGNRIIVRNEVKGNKFKTLDGREVVLDGTETMICDGVKTLAIGGVMGGENSMVTEQTQSVLIESACFNPVSIRKTARMHGYDTDASYRFERGVDPSMTAFAGLRAALLMKEYADAVIASPLIDVYPNKIEKATISLDLKFLHQFVGAQIQSSVLEEILESLEYTILSKTDNRIDVLVPTYKVDVLRPVDLVEDVLRIYSYNKIGFENTFISPLPDASKNKRQSFVDKIADYLCNCGFHEALTPSFIASSYAEKYPPKEGKDVVKTLNAVNVKLDMLRPHLLFSELEVLSFNYKRNQYNLKFFEIGKIYERGGNGAYHESEKITLITTGNVYDASWYQKSPEADFYYLKSILFNLLSIAGLRDHLIEKRVEDTLFAYAVDISSKEKHIARIGKVSLDIADNFDIKSDIYFTEIDFQMLFDSFKLQKTAFRMPSRFPGTWRDLSFLLDFKTDYQQVKECILALNIEYLKEIHLIDVYSGKNIDRDVKSYTISIKFQDDKSTLRDEQIDALMQKIIVKLSEELKASIRK